VGAKAYAETNASVEPTDTFAFYAASSELYPPTIGCSSFGYIYNLESGLCLTASRTSENYPDYQGASLILGGCDNLNCTGPAQDQLFCTDQYTVGVYAPFECLLFYGDTALPNSFYGPTYGPGPGLTQTTVLLDGGDCIFLLTSGAG